MTSSDLILHGGRLYFVERSISTYYRSTAVFHHKDEEIALGTLEHRCRDKYLLAHLGGRSWVIAQKTDGNGIRRVIATCQFQRAAEDMLRRLQS